MELAYDPESECVVIITDPATWDPQSREVSRENTTYRDNPELKYSDRFRPDAPSFNPADEQPPTKDENWLYDSFGNLLWAAGITALGGML